MNKLIPLFYLITGIINTNVDVSDRYITRQGQVTFFSYTNVENIEAKNNQVLSVIDFSKNEIAISMLMKAFVFKKALMREHFNESYIESDLYPKATLEGIILDFDPANREDQTKIVKGKITIRGITKEVEIKTKITFQEQKYIFSGDFELTVKDFEIKIPSVLAPNIAKNISVQFKFEYEPYEL
ncbi:YceI family protein [Aquimarina pacifica]|uniref:YceI family protein n=1 Tax=Aquimarina pacifica TaxID=1296415 RepID=UPI00047033B6|nr:YceI family protein [Aquimarina pacifica]